MKGKVALISGGTCGIGLAIAKTLKESGCEVVISGTNERKMEELNEKNHLDTVLMDYSTPEKFEDVINEVVSRHPGTTATGLIGFKEGDSITLTSNENEMNRLITPNEVANLAKLLVSDAGKMIDGEIIHISGGRGTFDIR